MSNLTARNIKELRKEGITYIFNAIKIKECNFYINRFEKLVKKFEKKYKPLGKDCQVIQNYFSYDLKLANLVYQKKIDSLLNELIDNDYVLINTSLINRVNRSKDKKNNTHLGDHGKLWHHDSRYVGNIKLDKGFGYIACIMFNDFTKKNGSTLYVPRSHNIRHKKPRRKFNYKCKQITGKAGTIAILDTGLWHRAGKVCSSSNRWSVWNYYGPWFMKPYFRYPDMLGNKNKKKFSSKIQRLFHYNSTPPLHELESIFTLQNHKRAQK